jgi:hypothetical protein|tara:strand:+ start:260 stop:1030 length:771 start_codon:yes stop_codon:yes gene_type:complete
MLEAEKIKQNWETYRSRVNDLFPTRKDQLNKMYDSFEDRIAMMPASSMAHFHNAFAGGYIDHVLRVMDCTETLYNTWELSGADMSGYTKEELMFAAMHHDLGKVGFPGDGNEVYQVETSDWHRKNMGRLYKHNENIPFTMVPDLSIWLLQEYNVSMTWNEYQAIKIHDGMYDDSNKPYFVARSEKAKLKTNMAIILHHGDHMAAQIEYEQWRNYKAGTPNPVAAKSKATKSTAMKNLAENNPNIGSSIADIFKDMT